MNPSLNLLIIFGFVSIRWVNATMNPPAPFSLTGKVIDTEGQPVADAELECRQLPGGIRPFLKTEEGELQRVTTDAKGYFEFRASPPSMLLLARKPGLATTWEQFSPELGAEPHLVMTKPSVLAGTVLDEAGQPMANARVFVSAAVTGLIPARIPILNSLSGKLSRDFFNAQTTAEGRFRIENFPTNASANLEVQISGKALPLPDNQGPDSLQWRSGQEDIRLIVQPAGHIEGRIVAEGLKTHPPLAEISLRMDNPAYFFQAKVDTERSREDGTFRISDLPAGSYMLRAVFGSNAVPEWVANSVPVSVEKGQTVRDITLHAVKGGLLAVAVLGEKDRQHLGQVTVSAYQQNFQATSVTDSNGLAVMRMMPGDYRINAQKNGWLNGSASASVENGQTNRIEIELERVPTVRGIVRWPDGQPAAGLPVQIVGDFVSPNHEFKTGADGKFELEWNSRRLSTGEDVSCLLIRDVERNLAVAQEFQEEETSDLDLRLAPGLTLAGRAECDGQPLTNASAALVFWTGNRGMHLRGLCTGTNVPGQFEIPALPPGHKYGVYVSAPGYGQQYVNLGDIEPVAKRVELDPVELRPANLKLAGQVLDANEKPVANTYVHISGEGQPNANIRTDREGRFLCDQVCEGQVRLFASSRNGYASISAEAGDTNVVLRLNESNVRAVSRSSMHKLKGVVTDPNGQPIAGAQLAVLATFNPRWTKTDQDGQFNLTWSSQPGLNRSGKPLLVVRDLVHNWAAAEELSEEITNLNVQLKPALSLTGRVEGPQANPLTNAQVSVRLMSVPFYSHLDDQNARVNQEGRFEIKALPVDQEYTLVATAKGHGQVQQKASAALDENRVELETFILKVADQIVSGQVLNSKDKPVPGANVQTMGEGQPSTSVTTDRKGLFKLQVCEGSLRLFASSVGESAQASVQAGDTNIILQLASRSSPSSRQPVRRLALQGRMLPDLTPLGFATDAIPPGKPLLVCLLDIEQRPSRRLASLLAEQYNGLRQKELAVLAIQAILISPESWQEWKDENPLPFPLGKVPDRSAKTTWMGNAESLPLLILADQKGRVVAEGFPIEELDAKLRELGQ